MCAFFFFDSDLDSVNDFCGVGFFFFAFVGFLLLVVPHSIHPVYLGVDFFVFFLWLIHVFVYSAKNLISSFLLLFAAFICRLQLIMWV